LTLATVGIGATLLPVAGDGPAAAAKIANRAATLGKSGGIRSGGSVSASEPIGTGRADEFVTLFRGDRPGTTIIKSYAARESGYLGSQRLIDEGNLDDLFKAHAIDSRSPPSSFISLTSDRRVAEYFAGPNGVVNEFKIPLTRAAPNPFNKLTVPAGSGGSRISEAEYLVPNYIRPSEFVTWPPKR
jgi:hypothetical protein